MGVPGKLPRRLTGKREDTYFVVAGFHHSSNASA